MKMIKVINLVITLIILGFAIALFVHSIDSDVYALTGFSVIAISVSLGMVYVAWSDMKRKRPLK